MPIPLTRYGEIKNRYCICYFGPCNEYIVQLIHFRPHLEALFPGVELYIGCKDSLDYLVGDAPRIAWQSVIAEDRRNFAHIKELKSNLHDHPVYEFLKESGIDRPYRTPLQKETTRRCIICPVGRFPVKSMSPTQIEKAVRMTRGKGYDPIVQDTIESAGWVVGVESEGLFLAASQGIPTTLVPTGPGKKLYDMIASKDVPLSL